MEYTDDIHIPDDAGEYREEIADILARIPVNWGRSIDCDKGWYEIIVRANNKIKFIDPEYKICQIKEKFGTLRYYYESKYSFNSIEGQIIKDIIRSAEYESSHTCEVCGCKDFTTVENRSNGYWLRTLCVDCNSLRGLEKLSE